MGKGNVFTICLILKVCGASSELDLEMLVSPSTDGVKTEDIITNEKIETLNYVDISDTRNGPNTEIEDTAPNFKNSGSGKRGSSMSIFNESRSKSNTKHFMVIDDSETSRKFMLKLLQITCKNIKLYEAVDGLDALVKLVKFGETMQPIDIIFVDNVMPNLTGEFLSKILRCIGYKGLIIGITGNGLEKDVKQFLNNGADYVFIKPFNKNKLNKILDFITTNGYTSKLNVTIVERDGKLMWAT
jgi:CheY-like chemotaxis protein